MTPISEEAVEAAISAMTHAVNGSVTTPAHCEWPQTWRAGMRAALSAAAPLLASDPPQAGWRDIATVPKDGTPVILANFDAVCLLSGAPHVWTARYATEDSWTDLDGNKVQGEAMWLECSHAAINENGEATHWMPLPEPPRPSRAEGTP